MSVVPGLPKVSKKKKINIKKFVSLAKKVRRSFEDEEKYLEEKAKKHENNNSTRFLQNL